MYKSCPNCTLCTDTPSTDVWKRKWKRKCDFLVQKNQKQNFLQEKKKQKEKTSQTRFRIINCDQRSTPKDQNEVLRHERSENGLVGCAVDEKCENSTDGRHAIRAESRSVRWRRWNWPRISENAGKSCLSSRNKFHFFSILSLISLFHVCVCSLVQWMKEIGIWYEIWNGSYSSLLTSAHITTTKCIWFYVIQMNCNQLSKCNFFSLFFNWKNASLTLTIKYRKTNETYTIAIWYDLCVCMCREYCRLHSPVHSTRLYLCEYEWISQ